MALAATSSLPLPVMKMTGGRFGTLRKARSQSRPSSMPSMKSSSTTSNCDQPKSLAGRPRVTGSYWVISASGHSILTKCAASARKSGASSMINTFTSNPRSRLVPSCVFETGGSSTNHAAWRPAPAKPATASLAGIDFRKIAASVKDGQLTLQRAPKWPV